MLLVAASILFGLATFGCAPLSPKVTDTSTPSKLASVLVKSFVREDESLFSQDLLFKLDDMQTLAARLNEEGEVSFNPKFIQSYPKKRQQVAELWQKIRQQAEEDGVLWKTVSYYGCRYKMRQHSSLLPLSMNFEIYFEVGGYMYRIDITSISHQGNYFIFDEMQWKGEVARPETVVLSDDL